MKPFFTNYFQKIHDMCDMADVGFFDEILHQIDIVKASKIF